MYDLLWLIMTTCNPRHFWPLRHLTREMERHEKIHFDKYNLTNTIWKMHFERLLTFRTKTKTKTISETCGIWDTHNNSGNWETEFLKIFVTWQWQRQRQRQRHLRHPRHQWQLQQLFTVLENFHLFDTYTDSGFWQLTVETPFNENQAMTSTRSLLYSTRDFFQLLVPYSKILLLGHVASNANNVLM